MKNKKSAIVIIILIIVVYPLQGTSVENIESERLYKDTKIGGYAFDIQYKDDPEYRYEYHYSFKRKEMICIVYNSSNSSVESGKYRPIN